LSTGALTYLKAALNLFLELGNKKEAAWVYYNLGTAYRLLKDPNTKETLDNALKEAIEIGDLELTGLIHLQLGLFYRETNPEVAYDNLKSAIRFHEKIRENVIYYEHHAGLNSRLGHDSFKSLIELCVDLDRKEEAFQILEQSKSIAFVSLMRYSKLVPKVNSNEFKSLVEKEEAYLRQFKIIQTSANTSDYSNTSEASKLVSEISDVYDKMQVIDPEYVNMRRGKITTFLERKFQSNQISFS
jgi:tetratricopeptide (TPR) repeat protein